MNRLDQLIELALVHLDSNPYWLQALRMRSACFAHSSCAPTIIDIDDAGDVLTDLFRPC